LDHLKDIDFHPLLDTFMELDASEIQAVDVRNESSCVFNGECAPGTVIWKGVLAVYIGA